MNNHYRRIIKYVLDRFILWLEDYGETSQDQYDFWAFSLGQRAKSLYYKAPFVGTIAVAPFVFLESFAPSTRKWFSPRRRFPIADAHYAMGFSYLFRAGGKQQYYDKAKDFLNSLKTSRCKDYKHYCWGYPFDWVGHSGMSKAGVPFITTTPYVYEAFAVVYDLHNEQGQWLEIMHSILEHALYDIKDKQIAPEVSTCSYSPVDNRHSVVNASAYRAFLLAEGAKRFSNDNYWKVGEKNLNFVLQSQQADGSWLYATDGGDCFIDHFHTCFVLKNLVKIERLINTPKCKKAIERGVEYYLKCLIDKQGLPKSFAKAPRITLYRHELYDYAESINLGLLLRERFGEFNKILESQLEDLTARWIKPDGSFRTRQLLLGWNNVPYHRWAQSQMFRSLSFWLELEQKKA
jgi:hypothetical protein